MASAIPWSDERVGAARKLYDAGLSARDSANALSVEFGVRITRNAVIGIWFRKGLGGRKKPAAAKRTEPRKRPSRAVRLIRPTAWGHLHVIESVEAGQAPVRTVEANPLHLDLLELRHDQCRYPFGDGPFRFCAQPIDGETSWCMAHAALCFQPARERRRA